MTDPLDDIAAAIADNAGSCHHGSPACPHCLAVLAINAVREYILDQLADDEQYQQWYATNVEDLDDIDADMTHAAVVAHYLVDVVLPQRYWPIETVTPVGGVL